MMDKKQSMVPTREDWQQFRRDLNITAILVGNWTIDQEAAYGHCYGDRHKRFTDGEPIYTSHVVQYIAGQRLLRTKNSLYLLVKGAPKKAEPDFKPDEYFKAGGTVQEMRLCELRHVFLKSDQLYYFTVDPNCGACHDAAEVALSQKQVIR